MGRKEVREFEKSKVVPYREVLPYSVAKVEFGEKGNFVRVILRGFSRQSNGDLCILYSWPTTRKDVFDWWKYG